MVSFGLVGLSGVCVQLIITSLLMGHLSLIFEEALPFSVATAATWNYLINNLITFNSNKLVGKKLIKGFTKSLAIALIAITANIILATLFYNLVHRNEIFSQIISIGIVFIWNYFASAHFVWKIR